MLPEFIHLSSRRDHKLTASGARTDDSVPDRMPGVSTEPRPSQGGAAKALNRGELRCNRIELIEGWWSWGCGREDDRHDRKQRIIMDDAQRFCA